METIHTLALVWMATRGLFVMASIVDISVPSGDVLIKKNFCSGCILLYIYIYVCFLFVQSF